VPSAWPEFTVDYRCGSSVYTIVVHEPGAVRRSGAAVTLDGRRVDSAIPLIDDGLHHAVTVRPLDSDGAAG
jgi:hypothetical protein